MGLDSAEILSRPQEELQAMLDDTIQQTLDELYGEALPETAGQALTNAVHAKLAAHPTPGPRSNTSLNYVRLDESNPDTIFVTSLSRGNSPDYTGSEARVYVRKFTRTRTNGTWFTDRENIGEPVYVQPDGTSAPIVSIDYGDFDLAVGVAQEKVGFTDDVLSKIEETKGDGYLRTTVSQRGLRAVDKPAVTHAIDALRNNAQELDTIRFRSVLNKFQNGVPIQELPIQVSPPPVAPVG